MSRQCVRKQIRLCLVAGLLFVGWISKHNAGAAAPPSATAGKDEKIARAGALYRRECAGCHGQDGKGARARSSHPDIPDFTSRPWQAMRSDAQLRVSILDGKGDGMPSFAEKLDEERSRDLVAFVRAFCPGQTAPMKKSSGDFESRFRALQEQLEALRRQFEELTAVSRRP
jgi:mono/diheme cytochrome c family protein